MLRLQNDVTQSLTEMFRMTKGLIKYISFELLHKQLPQMQWLKTISNDQFIFLQVRSSDRLGWPPALGLTRVLSGVNQARPFSGGCGEEFASKPVRLFVSRFQFLPLMVDSLLSTMDHSHSWGLPSFFLTNICIFQTALLYGVLVHFESF